MTFEEKVETNVFCEIEESLLFIDDNNYSKCKEFKISFVNRIISNKVNNMTL